MPSDAYATLAAGCLIWVAPFLLARRKSEAPFYCSMLCLGSDSDPLATIPALDGRTDRRH